MEKIAAFFNGWKETDIKPSEDEFRSYLEGLSPEEYRILSLLLDIVDAVR